MRQTELEKVIGRDLSDFEAFVLQELSNKTERELSDTEFDHYRAGA